jgi:hypothetical protein
MLFKRSMTITIPKKKRILKRTEARYCESSITPVSQQQFFGMPIIPYFLIIMNVQLKHEPSI